MENVKSSTEHPPDVPLSDERTAMLRFAGTTMQQALDMTRNAAAYLDFVIRAAGSDGVRIEQIRSEGLIDQMLVRRVLSGEATWDIIRAIDSEEGCK